MTTLNEKERRDFVEFIISTVESEAAVLNAAGYDSSPRVELLKGKSTAAKDAEVAQQKAQAASLEATKVSQQALKDAYDDASAFVNLIEGLLGKDNTLVHKLRQFRTK